MQKVVAKYPNYTIDEKGNVYCLKKQKYITHKINQRGYPFVTLYKKGITKGNKKSRTVLVKKLVVETFGENYEGQYIRQLNGNKLDVSLDNLSW